MVAISRARRRHAERMTRSQGIATDDRLSGEARLMFVVSCLICSDVGHLTQSALASAMQDEHVVTTAFRILERCGVLYGVSN